jgi:hypothetical protein
MLQQFAPIYAQIITAKDLEAVVISGYMYVDPRKCIAPNGMTISEQ